MLPLKWTRHIKNRMRWYDVTKGDVIEALASPDLIEESEFGKKHAWKRWGQGYLRVTFKDEGARRVIVTATPKRKLRGGD